jgi:hypothetical protein
MLTISNKITNLAKVYNQLKILVLVESSLVQQTPAYLGIDCNAIHQHNKNMTRVSAMSRKLTKKKKRTFLIFIRFTFISGMIFPKPLNSCTQIAHINKETTITSIAW